MKSYKDIDMDACFDAQDLLNYYEYKRKLNNKVNTIDLDKSANGILGALKYNVMGANLPIACSKRVNKLLATQDLSFLEYVNDVLVNEVYPKNIDHYVLPVEREDRSIYYEDCKTKIDGSILYTEVLDEEYLYLNTCINVMKMNKESFDKYVETFSKGFTSGLYKVIYDLLEYTDDNCHYSEVFNFLDLNDNLQRYSLDQLTCLKAYAKAKVDLIELHVSLDIDNKEDYAKHLDTYYSIAEAYYEKLKENDPSKRKRSKK
ncbi:MAG: hypothetical protein IKX00_03395 [Bacilli bacterium]|nr:hypothetical protein [Bacilli bacterium]